MKYDLEERTAKFAEKVIARALFLASLEIDLCKRAPKTVVTIPTINQLLKAVTSVGAKYCEANGGSSKRDFKSKIFICKKESKESKYWLRMLGYACKELAEECDGLQKEAQVYFNFFEDSEQQ